ncbi:MAG: hypothetical protein PHI40_03475 [Caldisericia bacterium]|nr:hypothetical protein [Caldisericia bacterium]
MKVYLKILRIALVASLLLTGCSRKDQKAVTIQDNRVSMDEIEISFQNKNAIDSQQITLTNVSNIFQADGLISDLYRIELGEEYWDEPIDVQMILSRNGLLDPPVGTISFGVGMESPGEDESIVLYQYMEALVQDETVSASFIPAHYRKQTIIRRLASESNLPHQKNQTQLYVGLFQHTVESKNDGLFRVYLPSIQKSGESFLLNPSDRQTFMEDLESVYQIFIQKGYRYSKRSLWPFDIYIQSLDTDGYYMQRNEFTSIDKSLPYSTNFGAIYLHIDLFQNGYQTDIVKPILIHEFFHFVQSNYTTPSTACVWFDEATASYYEWTLNRKLPNATSTHWFLLFDGVYPVIDSTSQGYARMPLIEYIAHKQSDDFIVKAYQYGGKNGDWEHAFYSSFGGNPANWASDFYEKVLLGRVANNYSPHDLYIELVANNKDFRSIGKTLRLSLPSQEEYSQLLANRETPLLGATTLTIPPFGARIVALTWDEKQDQNAQEGWNPVVFVEGDVSVAVIAMQGNKYDLLQGNPDVVLKNFPQSTKKGTQYLVFVVGLNDSIQNDCQFSVYLKPAGQY